MKEIYFAGGQKHFSHMAKWECTLTPIVGEGPVGYQLSGLQPVHQRPHPPWAPEKCVPSGTKRAELLHAPLFGTSILEPDLNTNTHTAHVTSKRRPTPFWLHVNIVVWEMGGGWEMEMMACGLGGPFLFRIHLVDFFLFENEPRCVNNLPCKAKCNYVSGLRWQPLQFDFLLE